MKKDRETRLKVKELLGIPSDEPIFILRAQDVFAAPTIVDYKDRAHMKTIIGTESKEWVENIESIIESFITWQRNNRNKVKVPD